MSISKEKNGFSVKAYRGDTKTLLAFNLTKAKTKNLAGFTIQYAFNGKGPFFIPNFLRFEEPSKHVQDGTQSANASINAPIHKFRWLHVPGSEQQGAKPFFGPYTYTVTPRYFDDNNSLTAIDPNLSVAVTVEVAPFTKAKIDIGFTRGFVQSQAFVNHFGPKPLFRPKGKELLFDTSVVAGKDSKGKDYTFADEYEWLGFTAQDRIFDLLEEVKQDKKLTLDVFAYDLNEPDVMKALLDLGKQGRVRIILDNAALHHSKDESKPEDEFTKSFNDIAKAPAEIMRGKFGRYAHDKVFILSNKDGAIKVMTGSTNFSVTGLYVNSNHVIVFKDSGIAETYAKVFAAAWAGKVSGAEFAKTPEATTVFSFPLTNPKIDITFSPHNETFATATLDKMAARIANEGTQKNGSVFFAVMGLDEGTGPVLPALKKLHASEDIFSYGISDTPGGIYLYKEGRKSGVLVSGKPTKTKLPPPFNQVPGLGLGHQIHHKFVVCGFNGKKPVVYCGSSNLALLGEQKNGDNLIEIRDGDVVTAFTIEALALVDHFDFLDRSSEESGEPPEKIQLASKKDQAVKAGWFLSTSDHWVGPYYEPNDLHFVDRRLFA